MYRNSLLAEIIYLIIYMNNNTIKEYVYMNNRKNTKKIIIKNYFKLLKAQRIVQFHLLSFTICENLIVYMRLCKFSQAKYIIFFISCSYICRQLPLNQIYFANYHSILPQYSVPQKMTF